MSLVWNEFKNFWKGVYLSLSNEFLTLDIWVLGHHKVPIESVWWPWLIQLLTALPMAAFYPF